MEHESSILSLLVKSTEIISESFDVFGVAILVIGISISTVLFLPSLFKPVELVASIHTFKIRIGRVMLLGLEVLIAADIVKTVALEPTIDNMIALGILIVVRTFLGWTFALEIDGQWPWQRGKSQALPSVNCETTGYPASYVSCLSFIPGQ